MRLALPYVCAALGVDGRVRGAEPVEVAQAEVGPLGPLGHARVRPRHDRIASSVNGTVNWTNAGDRAPSQQPVSRSPPRHRLDIDKLKNQTILAPVDQGPVATFPKHLTRHGRRGDFFYALVQLEDTVAAGSTMLGFGLAMALVLACISCALFAPLNKLQTFMPENCKLPWRNFHKCAMSCRPLLCCCDDSSSSSDDEDVPKIPRSPKPSPQPVVDKRGKKEKKEKKEKKDKREPSSDRAGGAPFSDS